MALCLLVSAAAASVVSLGNGQVTSIGGTASLNLTLDSAPAGLSGYNINVSVGDPAVARITAFSFPSWATLTSNSSVPGSFIQLEAVDLSDQIQPGAANIPLATIGLTGLKGGSTPVLITVTEIDDDSGNLISPSLQPGTFSVNVAQPVGTISVTSNPPGAEIFLDGADTGNVTPAAFGNIAPGDHTIAVSLDGFNPASMNVTVTAGSTSQADFQLIRIPQTGSISVTSSPGGAEISLDGTDTGKVTPFTFDNITPGDHNVAASLAGYTPDSMTVTVTAGSTSQADFQLVQIPQTGSLVVTSTPAGAAISLDGIDTGNVTPFTFSPVDQGSHTVELSLAGYQTANKTVSVTAGGSTTADFVLVPVPTTGSLMVTSTPAGAAVSIDGVDSGKMTPFTFNNLVPGDHVINVSLAGYTPASTTVTIVAGESASADFQLTQIPQTGSISVTSTPAGAGIALDGNDTGEVTPFTLDPVTSGDHTVTVNLAGYSPSSKTVTVSTGMMTNADFQLVPVPPQTGSISVTSSPPGAEISLDGVTTGKNTPATLDSVAPGDHTVAVGLAGYNPASKTVTVSAGSSSDVDFVLNQIPLNGSIAVSSVPSGAAIELDGIGTGALTPFTFGNVTPGDHAVSVSLTGYNPESQTVTVIAGSTATASFILVPAQQTGSISVTSVPAGAAIALDGSATGKITPAVLDGVAPGNHTVSVTLAGYNPASKTVTVTAGSTTTASFLLAHTAKQADLAITKTVSNATAYVGQRVTWTVTITNLGPDTARNILVTDDSSRSSGAIRRSILSPSLGFVSGSTWRIPSLKSGQIAQLIETDIYAFPGTRTDEARILKSGTKDPNTSNNDARASITILAKPVPAPSVTSITPASGVAGSTLRTVTVRGDQFRKGARVSLSQSGSNALLPTRISVTSRNKITFQLAIPGNTPAGAFDVIVTNPDGQTGVLRGAFTVLSQKKPIIRQTAPSQGAAGTSTKNFLVSGDNFMQGAVVVLKSNGQHDIVLSQEVVSDSHTIHGSLALPAGTKSGAWDVIVTNPDGKSVAVPGAFTVTGTTVRHH